ncbi:hypothetical protein MKX01_020544 [Papaver californicum]|nr:hypothetical protein MKX01_020544 [Papaver californicum]
MADFFLTLVHLILLVLLLVSSVRIETTIVLRQTVFSVTDYGAVGDGKVYDTLQIQAAIDACHDAGGGHVQFPQGNYLTGTIFLKSGVVLDIENSTILGGTKMEDYPLESRKWYVILAENATNVGISGYGFVDGQGAKFAERIDKQKNVMVSWNSTGACHGDRCRPRLVGFFDCKNVSIVGTELRQPAHSNLHIVRCDNTYIREVWLEGDYNIPNNKGIRIVDSNNTVIDNCFIDIEGDAITLRTREGPIYNLTVTGSELITKSSAIKLGSPSWFSFKGLIFNNIKISDSYRGIEMQLRDGGDASDITFSNIRINTHYKKQYWWRRAEPIYITTCPKASSSFSNIRFINISSHSEKGVVLSGGSTHEGVLRDLKFTNVNLTYYSRNLTEVEDPEPDGCQGLVNRNRAVAGMAMEHIDGLVIENLNMRWINNSHLKGWWINANALEFRPSTVNNVSLLSFTSSSN